MSSKKNTNPFFNKTTLSYCLCAAVFFALGLVVKRVPLVELEPKMNLGDAATFILAAAGLIGAWYFIPRVVEKAIHKRNSKDSILVSDIKELCELLKELKSKYQHNFSEEIDITEKIRGEILQEIRFISNTIKDLASTMEQEHPDLEFDKKIKNPFNEETYKILTEELPVNGPITKEHFLASTNNLHSLISNVKKFRFSTYK